MSLHNDYYVLTQHRHHEAELARELRHRRPAPGFDRTWRRSLLRGLRAVPARMRGPARLVLALASRPGRVLTHESTRP